MTPKNFGYDFNKIFDSTQEYGINRYEIIKLCNYLSDMTKPYHIMYKINPELKEDLFKKIKYVLEISKNSPLKIDLKDYDLIMKSGLYKYNNKTIKLKNMANQFEYIDTTLRRNKEDGNQILSKAISIVCNTSIDRLMFDIIEDSSNDAIEDDNNKITLFLSSTESGLTIELFDDIIGNLHGVHREMLVQLTGCFERNKYGLFSTVQKALAVLFYIYITNSMLTYLIDIITEIYNDLNFIITKDESDLEEIEEVFLDIENSLESLEITRMLSMEDSKNPVDSNNKLKKNPDDNIKTKKEKDKEQEDEDKKGKIIERIKQKVMQAPVQAKTFINKMRFFIHNRKSVFFYRKVLGKIDTLYDNYAAEAIIDESKFKDDPVVILKDVLCKNIIRIGKEMAILCDEVEGMTKKCAHATSKEQVIEIGEKWAKKVPDLTLAGEKMSELTLKKRIVYSTRTRMVDILMKQDGFKIPNYTRESMIVKELPTPNHYVISYMLVNPQEKPGNYPVEAIFKSADSFRIMANAEKNDIFMIGEMSNAVLKNKLDAATFVKMEERFNRLQDIMRKNSADEDSDRETTTLYKQVIDGFKESMEVMVKQKIYIANIINMYGNLIQRTDQLAIRCIRALLAIEAEKADPRYAAQLKGQKAIYKTSNTAATAATGDLQVRQQNGIQQ